MATHADPAGAHGRSRRRRRPDGLTLACALAARGADHVVIDRCGDHEVVHQQVADRVSRIAALSLRPASLLRNAFLAMAGRRALARELGDR
jgi:2-polyprenyl-6-methoxyphenol hydroxylase-like FAD-dependent oxidoreductase